MRVEAWLVALTRPDGTGTLDQNTFASVLMTPTGLPIERTSRRAGGVSTQQALQVDGDRLRASIRMTLPIPQQFPAGYYRPVIALNLSNVVFANPKDIRITTFADNAMRYPRNGAHLPIIKVGEPRAATFYWTLLANTLSGGSRGITAAEERQRFGISPRVALPAERFVVPRTDARSGATLQYNIEPFALTVAVSDRGGPPNPFLIPFRFPSGSLTATIRRPDGSTVTAGPSPFRQPLLRSVSTPQGDVMENGGHITDAVQLSTLDPARHRRSTGEGTRTGWPRAATATMVMTGGTSRRFLISGVGSPVKTAVESGSEAMDLGGARRILR